MANSEIIGAGQDTARRAPNKCQEIANGCLYCHIWSSAVHQILIENGINNFSIFEKIKQRAAAIFQANQDAWAARD